DEVVAAPVPQSSVLSGQPVSSVWVEADVRIVVSRNVTDLADGYCLCVDALQSVAYPVPGADAADVAADVAKYLSPQVAVVDAVVSSHGLSGSVVSHPIETGTLVVSGDALLVDVVGARLQGADPGVSRSVHAALAQLGAPADSRIVGDLTPYPGWQSAPALASDAVKRAGASAARLTSVVLSPVQT